MGYVELAALVLKGITVIEAAISSGKEATVAIQAVKNIVSKPAGTVTPDEMEAADRVLDDQLTEFNKPMPST